MPTGLITLRTHWGYLHCTLLRTNSIICKMMHCRFSDTFHSKIWWHTKYQCLNSYYRSWLFFYNQGRFCHQDLEELARQQQHWTMAQVAYQRQIMEKSYLQHQMQQYQVHLSYITIRHSNNRHSVLQLSSVLAPMMQYPIELGIVADML